MPSVYLYSLCAFKLIWNSFCPFVLIISDKSLKVHSPPPLALQIEVKRDYQKFVLFLTGGYTQLCSGFTSALLLGITPEMIGGIK